MEAIMFICIALIIAIYAKAVYDCGYHGDFYDQDDDDYNI